MDLYTEPTWTVREARHLLARTGFGASNQRVLKVHQMGRLRAVDFLFEEAGQPPRHDYPAWTQKSPRALREQYRQEAKEGQVAQIKEASPAPTQQSKAREIRRLVRRRFRQDALSLVEWWFQEMYTGRSSLREKMTLFWHDHFPVSARKVNVPFLLYEQNRLFHQQALGNFRTLTGAVVRDPALMIYLDANRSIRTAPNENLARELMELFTLGPGHYSERDIAEAARAMTGYQVDRRSGRSSFNKSRWDPTEKTILGQTGPFDTSGVVKVLFSGPRPASFLAEKLCRFFVHDNPAKELIEAVADLLYEHDYEMRPALEALFKSREFYASEVIGSQIKSPLDYYFQLAHQLHLPASLTKACWKFPGELGLALYEPPNVAGWNWGQAWITTSTLLARYNCAGLVLQAGRKPRSKENARIIRSLLRGPARRAVAKWQGPDFEKIVPSEGRQSAREVVEFLSDTLFLHPPSREDRAHFLRFARHQASREGLTDEVLRELLHLMMSSPSYQLT